jgi:uncharacterized NAD-dependent epimerase/dehydratase family protein
MNMQNTACMQGCAFVYCQGAFNTTNGKTAHGLVRLSKRYTILGIIDANYAGQDAGEVLDGRPLGIPVFADLATALKAKSDGGPKATHFVVGLAPDGGRLGAEHRDAVVSALKEGLHVVSGLHDFLSEDLELAQVARTQGVKIMDIRKPPPRSELHFFDGRIESVDAFKIAVLGTDSAVGKRTTAWLLTEAMNRQGCVTEMIGTGQTAWLQGVEFGIILDALVNDFVSGEIEYAVWSAWDQSRPEAMVIEGQGSLMNPAYPGGFEILAASRPDVIVLQHAPERKDYDGFPGYPMHPLPIQIQAIQLLSGKPVKAVTINHEGLSADRIPKVRSVISENTGLPAFDVLADGAAELAAYLLPIIRSKR